MKILISPAKKLDSNECTNLDIKATRSKFLEKSQDIINTLKEYTPIELSNLMNISQNLSIKNYERNQKWTSDITLKNGKQAILSFKGAVYEAMNIEDFSSSDLDFANKSIRILSGLYGILKPSDLIMPYRLEMGTNISIGQYKNLYYFWKDIITDYLLNDIKDDNFLINLASNEYFKVINSKKVNMPIITPIFKDTKNGKTKVISFYAKKARGSMCNYIIKNKINDIEGIKGFNGLGYSFNDSLSNQDSFIFTRNHQ